VSSLIKNLSFAQYISAISKSCFPNIRDLRCIRNNIDQTTAGTIANSLIHSKIDSSTQSTSTPKFHHITPILKLLNWLKINERIKYKVLSLTYKYKKLTGNKLGQNYISTTHNYQYLQY